MAAFARKCLLLAFVLLAARPGAAKAASAKGPLKVCEKNPRYFTDGSGKAIYLTGSHTWSNLVDIGRGDPPPRFDFTAYLDWMQRLNHNFIRLFRWELVTWSIHSVAPHPWARTGPGKVLDGKPRFDLKKFNQAYFDRLRSRVIAARDRGIYVSVMLFEGWGVQFAPRGWESYPFHRDNNINAIDGDLNGDGKGLEIYTLDEPAITALQKAYVRNVIDTVNDLDNVLYEISSEAHWQSTEWQYHMINFIRNYEKGKPKQHVVGMTWQYRGGKNSTLFESPADWVSPNPKGGYKNNPPVADGRKVVINDTDHLWGIGGKQAWVWKSFLRGHNPIFMDPYKGVVLGKRFDPKFDPIRRSMGYALKYANRMNLVDMIPRNDLASSKYCLANPGSEYLVYLPFWRSVTVDLSAASGPLSVEWFNPTKGATIKGKKTIGGGKRKFTAPFTGGAVLYIFRAER